MTRKVMYILWGIVVTVSIMFFHLSYVLAQQYQVQITTIKSKDIHGTYELSCEVYTGLQKGLVSVFRCNGEFLQVIYKGDKEYIPLGEAKGILQRWSIDDAIIDSFLGQGTVAKKKYLIEKETFKKVLWIAKKGDKIDGNPSAIILVDRGKGAAVVRK